VACRSDAPRAAANSSGGNKSGSERLFINEHPPTFPRSERGLLFRVGDLRPIESVEVNIVADR
jgi:hypothetical protein